MLALKMSKQPGKQRKLSEYFGNISKQPRREEGEEAPISEQPAAAAASSSSANSSFNFLCYFLENYGNEK